MFFQFSSVILTQFQFSESLFNESLNTESFKAAIIKNSAVWFKYFNIYYTKITQFKNHYKTLFTKKQQL